MTIQRINAGKGHSYRDTETGQKIPGVTTIIKALPKDALINWAASTTANYAVDNWEQLALKPPSVRLKELTGARYADSDKAANRGTQVHELAERLVSGARVAVPDELAGHVQSYVRFLDDFDVQPVLVEALVWSQSHGYCGMLDLVADLLNPDDLDEGGERVRWILDVKTNRSGVFGETGLQLAAYRFADFYIDGLTGEPVEMPDVTRTGVVHVRADGYDLVPVEAGEPEFRHFLYLQQTSEFVAGSRELVGDPVMPPTTSAYRLVRDE